MSFTPVPKPERSPRKARKPLPPSSSRPPRTAPPKPRNAKRKASEFARTYHSKERVQWVASQPCVWCVLRGLLPRNQHAGQCDNAHTTGGGMGRKGDYTTIAPMCRKDHQAYDEHRAPFHTATARYFIGQSAQLTHARWVAFSGGAENEEETA